MHEATLIAGLMSRIAEIARAENAKRIVCVSVWLGALSHMSAAHFKEHFELAARRTLAEGARLEASVSTDTNHAHAHDILLESVEVEI